MACGKGLSAWSLMLSLAAGGVACGDSEIFISEAVAPGEDCEFSVESKGLPRPLFDIAPGGAADSTACRGPYVAHLRVANPDDEAALVEEAEIELMTLSRIAIVFDRDAPALPNPFVVAVAGRLERGDDVVAVEVFPVAYADQLDNFVDSALLAQISLRGRTAGGDELTSNRFELPIEICDGCRTLCEGDPDIQGLLEDECASPAPGTAGTFCLDPDC